MKTSAQIKREIIDAGYEAIQQLIKVAKENILKPTVVKSEDDNGELSADRLKNAAATKKLAIFDAFEILSRIELEKSNLETEERGVQRTDTKQGFAERRSK